VRSKKGRRRSTRRRSGATNRRTGAKEGELEATIRGWGMTRWRPDVSSIDTFSSFTPGSSFRIVKNEEKKVFRILPVPR
jgi:hypothetical protein